MPVEVFEVREPLVPGHVLRLAELLRAEAAETLGSRVRVVDVDAQLEAAAPFALADPELGAVALQGDEVALLAEPFERALEAEGTLVEVSGAADIRDVDDRERAQATSSSRRSR